MGVYVVSDKQFGVVDVGDCLLGLNGSKRDEFDVQVNGVELYEV
nr:hypothetical protein [Bacillus thuringiensis]